MSTIPTASGSITSFAERQRNRNRSDLQRLLDEARPDPAAIQTFVAGLMNQNRSSQGSVGGPPGLDVQEQQQRYIGVPQGWYGIRPGEGHFVFGDVGQSQESFDPRYPEGMQFDPGGWTTERKAALQRDLVEAGLLQSSFRLGVWDGPTIDAYYQLLAASNISGLPWQDQLAQFKAMPEQDVAEAFRVPKILLPDMDELRNAVDETFEARLGREPTANERREMANWLMGRFEASRDQQVGLARAEFEESQQFAGMSEAELQLAGVSGGGEIGSADVGSEINPTEEFKRHFNKKYKDEKALLERRQQGLENTVGLQQGFDSLRAMIGGMGG